MATFGSAKDKYFIFGFLLCFSTVGFESRLQFLQDVFQSFASFRITGHWIHLQAGTYENMKN